MPGRNVGRGEWSKTIANFKISAPTLKSHKIDVLGDAFSRIVHKKDIIEHGSSHLSTNEAEGILVLEAHDFDQTRPWKQSVHPLIIFGCKSLGSNIN